MNKKSVLIVSYYFPPMGFSGALRGYYLAAFLAGRGYDVTVITTEGVKYIAFDDSLKAPDGIRIIKLKTYDPQRYFSGKGKGQFGILRKINAQIFPFDNKILLFPSLKRAIERIVKERGVDTIVSTSPPPSLHLSCMRIAKKYGINWIVDLRDALTDNQLKKSNGIVSFVEHREEKKIISAASKITVTTENILVKLKEKYPNLRDKIVLVRNGFSKIDFKKAKKIKMQKEKINIAYISRISHLTDIESILKALRENDDFVLHFAGVDATGTLNDLIERYEVDGNVIRYGYLPHEDALSLMKSADILLITLAAVEGMEDVTTAKLYEYFGAGKPILLIAPEGTEAEKLIKRERAGECVRNGATDLIADAIRRLYGKKGCVNPQRYTWEHSFELFLDYTDNKDNYRKKKREVENN